MNRIYHPKYPPKIWVYGSGSGGGALVGAGWCSALVGALAPGALVGVSDGGQP